VKTTQNSPDNSAGRFEVSGVRPEAMLNDYPMPNFIPSAPRVGCWGYLGNFVPAGLMHPEDTARYLRTWDGEDIYQCMQEEPPFVVVQNNAGHAYRVNPGRFLWIPKPSYAVGDFVQTKVGTARVGWIAFRSWHRKDCRLFYRIWIQKGQGRKLHTRRYWDNELELCTSSA
jgi:hypothetical protein